jgi:hypothetical protein
VATAADCVNMWMLNKTIAGEQYRRNTVLFSVLVEIVTIRSPLS